MPNYKLDYTPDAEKDMKMYKKSGEHIALKKLDMLLKELELHPPNWHWTTRTIKVLQKQRNLVASYHQKAPISLGNSRGSCNSANSFGLWALGGGLNTGIFSKKKCIFAKHY